MAFEHFFELPDDDYGKGFCLQEYKGKWFVQEANIPKDGDGTIYKSWISKYKKRGELLCKDNGEPYVFPLGVEVSEEAAKAIMALIDEGSGEDIPF